MKVRLVLVEDHLVVRQGLRAVLEAIDDFEVVGEASDGLQALNVVGRSRPDLIVLDLMLSGKISLEVARQVSQISPNTRVVILSMHSDVAYVTEALKAGAIGYILKDESAEQLVHALREAAAGRQYISPSISEESLRAYEEHAAEHAADPMNALTLREREILRLTAEGLSGTEIGQLLHISPRTVETHRANLMRKLNLRNQKEMVRFAVTRGLLPDHDQKKSN